MADLGIIFLRRKHTIHWYQSLFTIITGSMLFRYFWATLNRQNEQKHNIQKKKNPPDLFVLFGLSHSNHTCLSLSDDVREKQ